LIGPAGGTDGAWVCGGLSGYGIMASQAAGELIGNHIAGSDLPTYADAFLPSRWDDAVYVDKVERGLVKGLQI
jgi:glycine/D-amino acid oxidase-like deaminating enzyme